MGTFVMVFELHDLMYFRIVQKNMSYVVASVSAALLD